MGLGGELIVMMEGKVRVQNWKLYLQNCQDRRKDILTMRGVVTEYSPDYSTT